MPIMAEESANPLDDDPNPSESATEAGCKKYIPRHQNKGHSNKYRRIVWSSNLIPGTRRLRMAPLAPPGPAPLRNLGAKEPLLHPMFISASGDPLSADTPRNRMLPLDPGPLLSPRFRTPQKRSPESGNLLRLRFARQFMAGPRLRP